MYCSKNYQEKLQAIKKRKSKVFRTGQTDMLPHTRTCHYMVGDTLLQFDLHSSWCGTATMKLGAHNGDSATLESPRGQKDGVTYTAMLLDIRTLSHMRFLKYQQVSHWGPERVF